MNSGGQQQQTQVPTTEMYYQVLKEPRGMIRVLQWVFSIFAFATTAGFWTDIKFTMPSCAVSVIEFYYPFKIEEASNVCRSVHITGDLSTQAEYFVAVGVLTFLYCMAIMVIYLFFEPLYQSNALLPIIDLGFTFVFSIFWLTASSAWAQGVSDFKYYTDPQVFLYPMQECKDGPGQCVVAQHPSFATLNVSLIFGFANFALWGASLWFIYKETEWFKKRAGTPMGNNPS